MKPYYEHAGITIYHSSALAMLDEFDAHFGTTTFDLLLTDPPYGLNEAAGKNKSRGKPSPGLKMPLDKVFPATDYGQKTSD